MTISVKFTSDSEKWLRIKDNFLVDDKGKKKKVRRDDPFCTTVSTIGSSNFGKVTVEVSRDDIEYGMHDDSMSVEGDESYAIGDEHLPREKS